jgi:hypothetical protein
MQKAVKTHHEPPSETGFDLFDLVRVGVLMTDSLGFDVVPQATPYSVDDIRKLLPHAAQYRFDPDAAVMLARITGRLDAFD